MNLIDAFHVLSTSGFKPATTPEFHWWVVELPHSDGVTILE